VTILRNFFLIIGLMAILCVGIWAADEEEENPATFNAPPLPEHLCSILSRMDPALSPEEKLAHLKRVSVPIIETEFILKNDLYCTVSDGYDDPNLSRTFLYTAFVFSELLQNPDADIRPYIDDALKIPTVPTLWEKEEPETIPFEPSGYSCFRQISSVLPSYILFLNRQKSLPAFLTLHQFWVLTLLSSGKMSIIKK